MKITKLIFLDIDGVINSKDWSDYVHSNRDRQLTDMVDPNAVKKICNICEKTDARVIISSSWRTFDYNTTIQNLMKYKEFEQLIPYIVGITSRYESRYSRGEEIQYLLNDIRKRHYEHECPTKNLFIEDIEIVEDPKYVIIDDDYDMLRNQMKYFMRTDFIHGITEEQCNVIIDFLNGNINEILSADCNFWTNNHAPWVSVEDYI